MLIGAASKAHVGLDTEFAALDKVRECRAHVDMDPSGSLNPVPMFSNDIPGSDDMHVSGLDPC